MRKKAHIKAVPSIEEHKAAKTATLTEIETLKIRAEVARLRELDAVVANLTTQLGNARLALAQQNAKCKAMRDEVLTVYGFDPAAPGIEVDDAGEAITIRRKA